ncbi:MAG: hypothetical protein M5U25_08550 [Planctomycetota bacterium]|nr:hypothetical protein [Planctomycetota bacterium]
MSLEIRCNCGWTSQVSEFYLGDRVSCPDCGRKLSVHPQSGVPYGYAPYPTWQKRPEISQPARLPRRRRFIALPQDPHAAPAFVLGLLALILAFTGCGSVLSAGLALGGLLSAWRSRRWCRAHNRPYHSRAKLGIVFSVVSILLSVFMVWAMLTDGGRTNCRPHRDKPVFVEPVKEQLAAPGPRYTDTNQRLRELEERMKQYKAQQAEWERAARERGYRYPVEPTPVGPTPTPVKPRGDFQEYQQRYSNQVRQERAK